MSTSRRVFLALSQLLLAVVCSAQLVVRAGNYSVNLGENVELTCSVTAQGYDIGRNHTLNTTLSKVEGLPSTILNRTSDSDNFTYTETLILVVNSFGDEGEYICRSVVTSTNEGSELEVTTISFYLKVFSQALVTIFPEATNVTLSSSAEFICATRLGGVVEWKRNGDRELQFDGRIIQTTTGIIIANVTYADIGRYTCAVTNNATQIVEASANLTVSDYRPPFTEGTTGVGLAIVSTSSDQPFVECSVSGRPGPSLVYWEREVESVIVRIPRSLNESENGPVVDDQGRLDLERATERDSGLYTCTGVDVTGANASQTINVRIVDDSFFLWTQWYMILVYCVAGVAIVVLIVLASWFCYATRKSWWVPVAKKIRVKQKFKKPKPIPLDDFVKEVYGK